MKEYDATLYIPGTPFEMKGKVSNIVFDLEANIELVMALKRVLSVAKNESVLDRSEIKLIEDHIFSLQTSRE